MHHARESKVGVSLNNYMEAFLLKLFEVHGWILQTIIGSFLHAVQ
jgi:hypothetical protein